MITSSKEVHFMKSKVINMPFFSQTITDFWREQFLNGDVLYNDEDFIVSINPDLDENSRVKMMGLISISYIPSIG